MPYDPYTEPYMEEDRISPWATRDIYGNPLPIPEQYGIQDAPAAGFSYEQIRDAPPYGFRYPLPNPRAALGSGGEDYYTLSNKAFAGDKFAPGSEGSVAFDEPSRGGVRYPIALPASGGQVGSFGAPTADWQRVINEMIERDRPAQTARYNAEVARVDRNEIADAGEDPVKVQQAIRVRGTLKYNRLIADGATPQEALRLTANELYFNHPAAQVSAMNHAMTSEIPQISEVPLTGGTAILANGKYRAFNRIPTPKDLVAELDRIEGTEGVTQAMKDYNAALKNPLFDPAKLQALKDAIPAAQAKRRASTRGTPMPPPAEDAQAPSQVDIEFLISNPAKAPLFEKKFGKGSASRYLK